MSWGLASLLLLALALGVGFAWYERSRPSARLLAVVGTLAALAILGRIAFAPLPNVKPSTDIVLIAGYALGGAPGFAVGAVAAVGSNLFFGQGPWTPWQMAAWGLVGLFGAGLARAGGRSLRRWPLAIACGVAGLGYGVLLDLFTWTTFAGQHSLAQYGVIAAASLPFNLAHAIGNVVFFLAFGPGLVRAVTRSRARLEIVWRPVVPATIAALLAIGLVAAPAARASAPGVDRALAYLRGARNADGGWGGAPGQSSNGLHTAWAAYALAAAGVGPDALRPPTSDVLRARLGSSRAIGDVERTILALRAAGADPRTVGGRDLLAELLARRRHDGSFGGYVSYTSYAILALRASGESREVATAARWLARQANRDGGFNVYRRGGPSNADDTGYAVEALVAAGRRTSATVRHAVAFLRRAQHSDGGWPLAPGAPTNAQSTAFAAMGLTAARADPGSVRRPGGHSALAYLRALQAADGSVRYSRTSRQTPVWVTAQALVALAHRALPVLAPVPAQASAKRRASHTTPAGSRTRRLPPRHRHAAPTRAAAPLAARLRRPARQAGALLYVVMATVSLGSRPA